jgi:hypothetical protein
MTDPDLYSDDDKWMAIQHPDGWLYFFHPTCRVVVDARQEPFRIPISLGDDEEVYKEGSTFFKIDHKQRSRLSASYDGPGESKASESNDARRDYWKHIAAYPSHYPIYIRKTLLRASREALAHLRWCSLGKSVMPSTVKATS